MNDTVFVFCIIILAIVFLLARLEVRQRKLERTFGEILSGKLLENLIDGLKDSLAPIQRNEIKPASEETITKLSNMFEAIAKQEKELQKTLNKKINNLDDQN